MDPLARITVVDDWEDDWETSDIPDLRNKEEEAKKLKERKLVEESEKEVIDELFNVQSKDTKSCIVATPTTNFEKRTLKPPPLKRYSNAELNKNNQIKSKQKKLEKIREAELFGEASIDEYDEKYGYIEENY
jgi:hypothetical protein